MKRILFTITLLFISYLSTFAQKEFYFNTTKREDMKVESMQGVEIGSAISTISLFQPSYFYGKSFGVPLSMGYFNEKRIAPSWTLTTRIGLDHSFMNMAHYVFSKDSIQMNDSMYHFISQKLDHYKFEYMLNLGVSIEPRWYFGYKKRYQIGKAKLNTGWFLSLPVSVGATLINTYKPDMIDEYYSNYKAYCSLGLSGILGYRQAISKQWFLEGNLHLINLSSQIYSLNNKINISQPGIIIFPTISLKASYIFK